MCVLHDHEWIISVCRDVFLITAITARRRSPRIAGCNVKGEEEDGFVSEPLEEDE